MPTFIVGEKLSVLLGFSGIPYKRQFWLSAFALSAALAFAGGELRAASGTRTDAFASRVVMADDFYLGRGNLTNVDRAIQLLRQQVAENSNDYEAWWRISRSENFLGRVYDVNNQDKAAMAAFEAGADAGRRAVKLRPDRAEGHFWLGVNLGLIGEEEGLLRGLYLVDPVRKEMETVMRIDPDYEQRGAQRTLARVYYRAPFFKGGDKQRSIDLLQDCLKRYPDDSFALLYLADDYLAVGRRIEARTILQQILDLCPDPLYGPELANNQAEARARLRHELASAR